ncbi:alkanesulfonate monooxygenase [Gordonia polyisoprenivorans NBRC 16320 = JCM 10675]|uniref:LLM class flavin-dependent oxidoreductase n=1 Tax=Gordonia polyisoprenivorans TaxID=84595 RepID=A0A846WFE8_9ACTN|nr:LLM class flavin-dependent oxidoreductase [Gordonia polyisoprenivorans]NKY00168.1 LLM class flavin-dependent oxidoreductase [Gordonia polyisoprenivorans]GAB25791.1 alkanesulfonate monooxygenase [Gordonia polyisoprenivorans NBRC 16320 = JCM 10675]
MTAEAQREAHFHWFLPTSGDGREVIGGLQSAGILGTASAIRPPDLDYLALVAKTAERLGFESVLTPTGTWCHDAWLTTAALIREASRLKFLVAFRPGLITPTLAAQQAATFVEFSGGRLALNIVTGGDAQEQARFGDRLTKEQRYARTGEFLQIVRHAWTGTPFDFSGEHYDVTGAVVGHPPNPVPQVFFGGASEYAREVAAATVDTYLTWTEPPEKVAELVEDVRARAARHGRELTFGIRAHVITRDTREEAWAEARKLVSRMDPALIELARQRLSQSESEGQRRQLALNADLDNLEVYPGLWAGYGLVRPGAGTAFVGSHAEVADLIAQYRAIGIDHFILSGQPHIEEAFWFAEGVAPLVRSVSSHREPAPARTAPRR